jgi:sulfite oxidase
MNGETLPKDHGYPLRLVVPGFIGVRNCKWVCKLEISDEEAPSCMQRRDYKWIEEQDWSKIDFTKYPSINGNVLNSCICQPKDGDIVGQQYTMKGYAAGDGTKGTQVTSVEVSIDGGLTWEKAEITHKEDKPGKKVFSWTLWKFEVTNGCLNPMVRAIDNTGSVQNGKIENMFNVRGLLNTTPHTVEL